ncbi:MAG: hypothetical protein Q7S92_00370 [Candidatus Diapherotrites archaeon]|nr:hypothetical protein [Candidatus Diapherotrites archaeon]
MKEKIILIGILILVLVSTGCTNNSTNTGNGLTEIKEVSNEQQAQEASQTIGTELNAISQDLNDLENLVNQ